MPIAEREDDEYNPIPEDLTDELDEQDIHDEDRQVLNDRVLGIINIFQTVMAQNKVGLNRLPSKHLKALEDLATKALSIEKQVVVVQQPKTHQIQFTGPVMHTNLRYEARKKSNSKQNQESASKKGPTKQGSLTKEALTSQLKRKGARSKMPSSKDVLAPHPHAYPLSQHQSAAKPKCTICNIKIAPAAIS